MYYDFFKIRSITKIGKNIITLANKKIVKIIKKLYKPKIESTLLEIGVGKALFATILKKEIPEIKYFGIEPNKDLCLQAVSKGLNVINTKIPPVPKKFYNKFDFVYMSHVLEHFVNYEVILKVLSELRKTLKKNGKLIIFYPDFLDYKDDYFDIDYSHEYILTKRRVKQILIDCSFKIIKSTSFRGCFIFPYHFLIYPFHKIIKIFAGLFYTITKKEIFFKMKITFGKNILVIAEKIE
jgi:SAM-dependent methyltransferase